ALRPTSSAPPLVVITKRLPPEKIGPSPTAGTSPPRDSRRREPAERPGAGAMPCSKPSSVEATCKSATTGTPAGGAMSELSLDGIGATVAGGREGSAQGA